MKYARLDNSNIVSEIFTPQPGFTIQESFTPEVVNMFEPVTDDVEIGWQKNSDGSFSPPLA